MGVRFPSSPMKKAASQIMRAAFFIAPTGAVGDRSADAEDRDIAVINWSGQRESQFPAARLADGQWNRLPCAVGSKPFNRARRTLKMHRHLELRPTIQRQVENR